MESYRYRLRGLEQEQLYLALAFRWFVGQVKEASLRDPYNIKIMKYKLYDQLHKKLLLYEKYI